MNFSKFHNPPASDALLTKLVEKVIYPSYKNLNTSIINFRGSGTASQLKYLCKYHHQIENYNSKHLLLLLDLDLWQADYKQILTVVLNYAIEYQPTSLTPQLIENIVKVQKSDDVFSDFMRLIYDLTFKNGYGLTFIVDNFSNIYSGHIYASEQLNLLEMLRKTNPMNISFVMLAQAEFDSEDIINLEGFGNIFMSNVISGKELLFDNHSVQRLFSNMNVSQDLELRSKTYSIANYDPTILKHIAIQTSMDRLFTQKLINITDVAELYSLVGKDFLDNRFLSILKNFKEESFETLKTFPHVHEPTDYLLQTGLIINKDSGYRPFSMLFEHFLVLNKNNLDDFKPLMVSKTKGAISLDLKNILSPKELLVMKALLRVDDNTLSREEVAAVMWGDSWESEYSEQAIDKLISNLRKKLLKVNYQKTLKSLKGRGVVLI